jgi:hypothetical protein
MNFPESNRLVMRAFNRWIVSIRKGSRHERIGQRGFADGSESQNRHFAVDQRRIFILAHLDDDWLVVLVIELIISSCVCFGLVVSSLGVWSDSNAVTTVRRLVSIHIIM